MATRKQAAKPPTTMRSLKPRKAKTVKAGEGSPDDFAFVKKVDEASPVLFQ